eukprot:TRINITY_DN3830_c0_g1_i1.p1 TRINITY_DN3830_c0_g1~~TRINITY_DN3830_c0_g1_i1.p1  ORF type:complete len:1148 (+),score=229.18 TRINITY_DN3830_c0_g1_i1:39-3446(+)
MRSRHRIKANQKFTIICEEQNQVKDFYEIFSYFNEKVSVVDDFLSLSMHDVIVVFCDNSYGLFSSRMERVERFLKRKIGSEICVEIRKVIADNFLNEQPVGNSLIVDVQSSFVESICWVCVSRAPGKSVLPDLGYSALWSALSEIYKMSTTRNVKNISICDLSMFSEEKSLTVNQMAFGIQSYLEEEALNIFQLSDAIMRSEMISQPAIKSREEKEMELNGLLWSKQLSTRGLVSVEELEIIMEWVKEEDKDHPRAASILCELLAAEKMNPFALTPYDLSEILLKDTTCLEILLSYAQTYVITLHSHISRSELIFGNLIGTGGVGSVYMGMYHDNFVAIKVFKPNADYDILEFSREIALLSLVRSKYVVRFFGGCCENNDCIIVTELMEGSLFDILHDESFVMDYTTIVKFALRSAKCILFFHSCGLIHRDLKSLNLLISRDFKIKLCDFGSSRIVSSTMTHKIGTVAWIPPEIFQRRPYTQKVDTYSFGIVMWELLTRKIPFGESDAYQIPLEVSKGARPPVDKDCPKPYKKLMTKCWTGRPKNRPYFDEIVATLDEMYMSEVNKKKESGELFNKPLQVKRSHALNDKMFEYIYGEDKMELSYVHSGSERSMYFTESSYTTDESEPSLFAPKNITTIVHFPHSLRNQMSKLPIIPMTYFESCAWNTESGRLVHNKQYDRYVLMQTSSLGMKLKEKLGSFLPAETRNAFTCNLLRDIGACIGRNMGEIILCTKGNRHKNRVYLTFYFLAYMGWATAKIKSEKKLQHGIFIIADLPYTFESDEYLETSTLRNECTCDLVAGFISGCCSVLLNDEVHCTEVQCRSTGDTTCRMIICTKEIFEVTFDRYVKRKNLDKQKAKDKYFKSKIWLSEKIKNMKFFDGTSPILEQKRPTTVNDNVQVKQHIADYLSNMQFLPNDGKILTDDDVGFLIVPVLALSKSIPKMLMSHFSEYNKKYAPLFTYKIISEIAGTIGEMDFGLVKRKLEDFGYDHPIDRIFVKTLQTLGWGRHKIEGVNSQTDFDGNLTLLMRISGKHSFETSSNREGRKILFNSIWTEGYISGYIKAATNIPVSCISVNGSNNAIFIVSTGEEIEYRIREHLENCDELHNLVLLSKARISSQYLSRNWLKKLIDKCRNGR